MNEESKFQYVVKAFQEEPIIEKMNNISGWTDESHQNYIKQGISSHVFIKKNSVKLQFLGWELVLLKDGTYYINDTSGG